MRYTIDDLIEIFDKHAKEVKDEEIKRNAILVEMGIEPNPLSDFNISTALACICKEIKNLKDNIPR